MAKKTSEQLVGIFEDQRDLKNLMGKVCYTILLKNEKEMVDSFWAAREDICLGINKGYYLGRDAVKSYYNAVYQHTLASTEVLKKAFPQQLARFTEEEQYGIGSMDVKPMDTAVVEVAEDGATAKGIWYSRGTYNDITPQGPVSYWDFAVFACDFVREETGWKIWHMLRLSDIVVPCGKDWGTAYEPYPDLPEFAEAHAFAAPEPTVAVTLHEAYYPGRPFSRLPEPPQPYTTFAETFSYGYEKEA